MMRINGQFLITEQEKVELGKILSVKAADKDYLPAPVLPLLLVGILLILFLHPLCSLLFLAPAAWLTACHSRKAPYAMLTVCTAASTYMVKVSGRRQIKELEAAICKARSSGKF